jgi:hypothetical protein
MSQKRILYRENQVSIGGNRSLEGRRAFWKSLEGLVGFL